jgi:hypothetical protein
MRLAERRRSIRQVRCTFEANRLAYTHLQAAYEQIVPVHIRVVSRYRRGLLASGADCLERVGREGRAA